MSQGGSSTTDAYNLFENIARRKSVSKRFNVKDSKNQYEQQQKIFEKQNALPENMNLNQIFTQVQNKPYLKMYQQKNGTHDSDREKPSSIICNIITKKLKKNKQNILFGMIDEDENEDKNLDFDTDTLIYLGQIEKNKMTEVLNKSNEEELSRRKSVSRLEVIKENIIARKESIRKTNKIQQANEKKEIGNQKTSNHFDDASTNEIKEIEIKINDESLKQIQNPQQNQLKPDNQTMMKKRLNLERSLQQKKIEPVKCLIVQVPQEIRKHQKLFQKAIQVNKQNMKAMNKNLKSLIIAMKIDKSRKEFLKNNPELAEYEEMQKKLQQENQQKKGPKMNMIKNLPLNQKLLNIEKYNLDSKKILNKAEINILKLEQDMYNIPKHIKITNLKKLLHKNFAKVNKWIKCSLNGTYQHDFEFFMQNDRTIVDKNSLLYQKLLDEQKAREILSQKLEDSKGGYIDPNMRAIDLTYRKIIKDILMKYQVKNHLLLPIFDEKKNNIDLKMQDINKLQEEIIKEHEEIERKLRLLKEKKFNKWKIINQQFKQKQAHLGKVINQSPDTSPSLSPKSYRKVSIERVDSPDIAQQSLNTGSPSNMGTFSSNGKVGQKFREFLMEKLDKQQNQELVTKLDEEIGNQNKMLKNLDKDLEEFHYFNIKKQFGDMKYDVDPLLPEDYYVKNSKNKHFSKNIALWKQQELYDDLHGDWATTLKKFRILQNK
ncbi:UNKNOWN [Stylonychia lemnae]|uniref:Uncharacterized protein n=1 Tax=Stylonychia lemnae TaxID=5949 RepID=A0A078AX75_STYLE|nr:UNKNOWN [Stylonychia lemnae]|eukprot:CDW87055.1 UNKNOWN [Stylonychia lemnae]